MYHCLLLSHLTQYSKVKQKLLHFTSELDCLLFICSYLAKPVWPSSCCGILFSPKPSQITQTNPQIICLQITLQMKLNMLEKRKLCNHIFQLFSHHYTSLTGKVQLIERSSSAAQILQKAFKINVFIKKCAICLPVR